MVPRKHWNRLTVCIVQLAGNQGYSSAASESSFLNEQSRQVNPNQNALVSTSRHADAAAQPDHPENSQTMKISSSLSERISRVRDLRVCRRDRELAYLPTESRSKVRLTSQ